MKTAAWAWIVAVSAASATAQTPQIVAAPNSATDKPPVVYQWRSSTAGQNRLLFEEPRLERQGISRVAPAQLAQSSAVFFSRSLLLPVHFLLGRHRDPAPVLRNND